MIHSLRQSLAYVVVTLTVVGASAQAAPQSATPSEPVPMKPTKVASRTIPAKSTVAAAPQRFPSPVVIRPRRNAPPPNTPFEFNGKTYYRSLLPERRLALTAPTIVRTIKPDGTVVTTEVPPLPRREE